MPGLPTHLVQELNVGTVGSRLETISSLGRLDNGSPKRKYLDRYESYLFAVARRKRGITRYFQQRLSEETCGDIHRHLLPIFLESLFFATAWD